MVTVYADAYGFNATDATATLQAAIDSGADRVIVRNQGTPWLISSTIQLKSNQEIRFEPNVVVKAKSGSFLSNTVPLFQALGINNIKLIGEGIGANQATLAMNKNEFSSTSNSYGHIIGIRGTDNYTISGLTLTGAGGDGIIVDAYSYGQPIPTPNKLNYSANGLIDNVTAISNRRNGLSIISAQNLLVTNSKFINTSDENPANGIDVEPDFSYNRLSNITIKNVDLSDNQGHGLGLIISALDNNSTPVSINIDGATIDRNGATGIKIGAYGAPNYSNSNDPNSTPNGAINISNVTIAGTKGTTSFYNDPNAAISIEALSGADPNNVKINFSNIAISDTGFNAANPQLSAEPIFIRGFGGPDNRNQIGNVSFDNVTVADNFDRNIIGIYLNQSGSLNNITGNIRGINPNGVTSYVTPETTTETRQNFTLTVTTAVSPLVGTSGNDTFNPGKGAIAIDGGAGNDTLILNNSADIASTTINYTNTSNGTITGGFNIGTTFKNIESVIFTSGAGKANVNLSATTGNNTITGSQGLDTLIGGTGDDTLTGVGGADRLSGGNGSDTYIISLTSGSGTIIDDSAGMNDTIALTGGTITTNDISRSGTSLIVDLNGDRIFEPAQDLSINNYFANITGSQAGSGLIENIGGLSGTTILNLYTPTRTDFDGDRKSDILWRNDDGRVALWQMNGSTVTTGSYVTPTLDSTWKIASTADVSGDGKADLLWRNDNGTNALWTMNGSTIVGGGYVPTLDSTWKVASTADFDGDKKADLLWRKDDGTTALWKMDGATVVSGGYLPTLDSTWKVASTADFDGDKKADLLWRKDDGTTALWKMNGSAVVSGSYLPTLDSTWKVASSADFNGDGKTDLLWRKNDGTTALWTMNGSAITAGGYLPTLDSTWKVASSGDFNGDGKAEILWRNDNGTTALWTMNGSTVLAGNYVTPTLDSSWQVAAPIL
jgi:FG-GAP-like repeat/RTX calcium-binding nonapeptide repeat (4 copies)